MVTRTLEEFRSKAPNLFITDTRAVVELLCGLFTTSINYSVQTETATNDVWIDGDTIYRQIFTVPATKISSTLLGGSTYVHQNNAYSLGISLSRFISGFIVPATSPASIPIIWSDGDNFKTAACFESSAETVNDFINNASTLIIYYTKL